MSDAKAKKGGSPAILVFIGVFVAIAIGLIISRRMLDPATPPADAADVVTAPQRTTVSDEERADYIQQFIEISDLNVDPDTQIDANGEKVVIPGLLRVSGNVENKGDLGIDKLLLVVKSLDAEGKVLGADHETLAEGRTLEPKSKKPFRFQIRDRERFDHYEHELR